MKKIILIGLILMIPFVVADVILVWNQAQLDAFNPETMNIQTLQCKIIHNEVCNRDVCKWGEWVFTQVNCIDIEREVNYDNITYNWHNGTLIYPMVSYDHLNNIYNEFGLEVAEQQYWLNISTQVLDEIENRKHKVYTWQSVYEEFWNEWQGGFQ